MKFGLVHRIMTDALAILGLLSLLTGGELDPIMAIVTGVCMVLAVLIPERYQEHPRLRSLGVFASLTLLGVQLTRAVSGGDLLELSVEFAAALQVIRVATRRGAAHDQQIILLALLHLVAGTVLAFARALGEFGATAMVAGNIPGRTTTVPLAIYFLAEAGDLRTAGVYALIISAACMALIVALNVWTRRRGRREGRR